MHPSCAEWPNIAAWVPLLGDGPADRHTPVGVVTPSTEGATAPGAV